MTPERLAEIREAHEEHVALYAERGWLERGAASGSGLMAERAELLAYVNELTRQLDDARDKAINAGIFTSSDGDVSKYTHALNTDTCEGCGDRLSDDWCYRCETEISTPGATSYKP